MQVLEEIYEEIREKTDFTAFDKFEDLIKKTITKDVISGDDNPKIFSVSLKFQQLLEGLVYFANSKGKEKAMDVGAQTLLIITDAMQFDLDENEAFLLYHLNKMGKFRKRESDLLSELKKLWQQYPEYEMEEREFSRSLKNLMRAKFINYRKGNILLNTSFVVRYKN